MANKGNLFLIPVSIAAETNDLTVTPQVFKKLPEIRHFLAEDLRTARRYLSSLGVYQSIEPLSFSVLDKNTVAGDLEEMFAPVFEGYHLGVMSESGCPGVADPGALAARFAHNHGIRVIPLVGPSSILLALMASGLNGQRFAFHGYLPVDSQQASRAIRDFEKESRLKNQTQIFIETPYRNKSLLATLVKSLAPDTDMCVAMDITGEEEFIETRSVSGWKASPPVLIKKPAVFLFLANTV